MMIDEQRDARVAAIPTKICVYISRAAPGLSIDDVRSLVFEARGFNAINGITGLLTYDRRGFLQAVEGTGDAIDELIAAIMRDSRHRDMDVILTGPPPQRQFASFHDFVCEGDRLASLALLPHATLARLSGDVAGAIGMGFSRL